MRNRKTLRAFARAASVALAATVALSSSQAAISDTEYAVIANPECGVTTISLSDAQRIFKREAQFWPGKGKVAVNLILPASSSDEMKFALKKLYSMDEKTLKKYWVEMIYQNKITSRPKQLPNAKLLTRMVAKSAGSASIVKVGDITDKAGVLILKIDGKGPGDKGYALTGAGSTAFAPGTRTAESLGQFASVDRRQSEATEASSGAPDANDERMDELENALLDLQMDFLTGDSDGDPFEGGPLFSMKGFGHVQLQHSDEDGPGNDNSKFALGGVDLFISSQLSENLSFLNETVLEPTDEGSYVLDVERVILKYRVSDKLNIQAGRFHTTLGHWNEAFHHGEWLSASIGRPEILNFEDENGLLPVHLVGVVLNGWFGIGDSSLSWAIEAGNGRGADPDPPQITVDANNAKAINLNVAFQPSGVPGLKVGGGIYIDDIPAGGSGMVHGTIDETILNAFIVYKNGPVDFMTEYYDISHKGNADPNAYSNGFYAQFGYQMGAWKPYVRYDNTNLDDEDKFFAGRDDSSTIAGGIRYDYSNWSALKLQYNMKTTSPEGGGADVDSNSLALQVSFAF